MKQEKNYKSFKATLTGKDGFLREILISRPSPQIFIPLIKEINVYLEKPTILPKQVMEYRTFLLEDRWKNKLQYKEI